MTVSRCNHIWTGKTAGYYPAPNYERLTECNTCAKCGMSRLFFEEYLMKHLSVVELAVLEVNNGASDHDKIKNQTHKEETKTE